MKLKKLISLIFTSVILASLCSCQVLDEFLDYDLSDEEQQSNSAAETVSDRTLITHYIDVGQGDSEFIEFPNGKTMLIDAGPTDAGQTVVDKIKELGYSKIDYLIGTHPHADHIGGMRTVVNSFDIGEIYMPKISTNTKTYEKLLTAIQDKGLKIKTAKAGIEIINEDDLSVNMIAPVRENYDKNNLNLYSAVITVKFGDTKFLFMGDAEEENEKEITDDVSADVIKVGHHGSNTSSSEEFVEKVSPKYAIFSLGEGNSYHHPHTKIVQRWENIGAEILRTDQKGTITIKSDGSKIQVTDEKDQ